MPRTKGAKNKNVNTAKNKNIININVNSSKSKKAKDVQEKQLIMQIHKVDQIMVVEMLMHHLK